LNQEKIVINVEAIDNASGVIAGASQKIADSLRSVETIQKDFSLAINESVAPLAASELKSWLGGWLD